MKALASILDRLEKQQIIDEVMPLLWNVKLQEPEIVVRVVSKWISSKTKLHIIFLNFYAIEIIVFLFARYLQAHVEWQKIWSLGESDGDKSDAIVAAPNSESCAQIRKLQFAFGCSSGNAQSNRKVIKERKKIENKKKILKGLFQN